MSWRHVVISSQAKLDYKMGYITQLGIFHNNMFNHFNLSCDLMEPFRVLADRVVYAMKPAVFEKDEKYALWRLLDEPVQIDGCRQLVSAAIRIYTKSVLDAVNDADPFQIKFYQILPHTLFWTEK